MKNFYFTKLKMITTVMTLFISMGLFAQSNLTWTGANSSEFTDPTNWDPQGNIEGNNIVMGHADTYTYECLINGSDDVTVENVTLSSWVMDTTDTGDTIWHAPSVLNINMDQGTWFNQGADDSWTPHGIMNVTGGNYYYKDNKTIYLQDDTATHMNFNCDTAIFRLSYFLFANHSGDMEIGGVLTVAGHTYMEIRGDFGRIPKNNPAAPPSVYLLDEATIKVTGRNIVQYLSDCVDSGQIVTNNDRDVVVKYDALENSTTLSTRLKDAFEIEPTDRQVLIAGEEGSMIAAIQNDGLASMESIEWKYGTSEGGPYDHSFTPAENNDTIYPNFTESGNFYLVLEGMKGGNAFYTNEVNILVSSSKAIVTPDAAQNIRLGQQGQMLTVTETPAGTSREWKYSTTPGGPYESFSTQVTGTEFSPNFTEVGTYFVVCISQIDGSAETSKEVQFNILASNAGAMNLTFTGAESDDAGNMFNWDPAAYINNNNLKVPDDMHPVLSSSGNDTVANFDVRMGATFTVNKPSLNDTLVYTADHNSSDGSYVIEGGVFVKTRSYFRLYSQYTTFTVKNDAKAYIYGTALLLGGSDNPANGANIIIQDDAQFIVDTDNAPGRISANKGYSEMRLSGNAKYIFMGDLRSSLTPLLRPQISGEDTTFHQKFITPEGFEPYLVYDPVEDVTTVTARDLSALAIEQTITQIVGVGQETNPLSLINSSAYTSFEWQYSKSAAGPWSSFETPKTGETATFAFDTAGVVFVRCLADGSVASSNAIAVRTVKIPVSPASYQNIDPNTDGTTLSVDLPDGVTGTEWKYSTTSGSGYEGFFPIAQTDTFYTPNFFDVGTYFVVFEAVTTDDNGQDVVVYSNEVTINVGNVAIDKVNLGNVSVFPNPARSAFYVDGGDLKSYQLQVVNLQGAVVFNRSYNQVDGPQKVDFNKSGYYLIKLVADEGVKVGSLVIE
ncbi:T9SS type A sorting domain-containing protein [Saccharicrinis sp. FJH54]|uniref:T9SS type A sorting domain-containing protein n=1 Tax=Saccharicrinis sp. FJH54 TaxID=3344665 RepID=UPI0035D45BA0